MGVAVSGDRKTFDKLKLIMPIVIGIAFVVAVVLLLQSVSLLTSWSTTFSGRGTFTVDSCSIERTRGSDRVLCDGRLSPETSSRTTRQTPFIYMNGR